MVESGAPKDICAKVFWPILDLTCSVQSIPVLTTVSPTKSQYWADISTDDYHSKVSKMFKSKERKISEATSMTTCPFYTQVQVLCIGTDQTIGRFYAAGEIVSGIHGACRLGSNAIPECLIFGRIAGRNAAGESARS